MNDPPQLRWSVVVPVKSLTVAKSRLEGLPAQVRRNLALAFGLDTVAAVIATGQVAETVVVTNDATREEFERLGALVVADRPDAGLNPAILHGEQYLRSRDADVSVLAMTGDLPGLRPDDLSQLLTDAVAPYWFVADAHGTGTTMLAAAAGRRLSPAFGPGSRAAHEAQGAVERAQAGARARRDVDTLGDLWDAVRHGVGPRTAAAVERLAAAGRL